MCAHNSILFDLYREGVLLENGSGTIKEQECRYKLITNLCNFVKTYRPQLDIYDYNHVVDLKNIFFKIIDENCDLLKNVQSHAILCMDKNGHVDPDLRMYSHYFLGTHPSTLTHYNKAFMDYKEYLAHVNQANIDSGINTDF